MAGLLSGGALPLFSFRGIAVRLHWSFALLPAYVLYSDLHDGDAWGSIAMHLGMVGITFACVVLHEFGHALTARRYGIGTKSITLLPIGGVAALERMPEEPRQEFWITVAGPAVNLAIALLAVLLMAALGLTAFFTDLFLGGEPSVSTNVSQLRSRSDTGSTVPKRPLTWAWGRPSTRAHSNCSSPTKSAMPRPPGDSRARKPAITASCGHTAMAECEPSLGCPA